MPLDHGRLTLGPIPAKFDRAYMARGRATDQTFTVNLARLECSCPEWRDTRAGFLADDARRVCPHLYDKLYATKVERSFDPLAQLFIRYGRGMLVYRVVEDDLGVLLIGQPFGPTSVRAVGLVNARATIATFDLQRGEWSSGETDLSGGLAARILDRMRAAWPEVFANP